MEPCRQYYVAYKYSDNKRGLSGFGSIVITQKHYAPISPKVLDDAVNIIRKESEMSKDAVVVIQNWKRFEAEDTEDVEDGMDEGKQ